MTEPDLIISHYEDLLRHAGWAGVVEVIDDQIKKQRDNASIINGRSMEEIAMASIAANAAITMLSFIKSYPEQMIKAAKEQK